VKLIYVDAAAPEPQTFDLKKSKIVRFGRAREGNQVVLRCRRNPDDPRAPEDPDFSLKISRHHMEIVLQDGRPAVVDRGSKKGTFLTDRQLAPHEPYLLGDGDVIKVSDVLHLHVAIQAGQIRLTREEPPRRYTLVLGKRERRLISEFLQTLEGPTLAVLRIGPEGGRDKVQGEIVKRDEAGRLVKSAPDGLWCIFGSASTALARAAEILEALQAKGRQALPRMGLDSGAVPGGSRFDAEAFGRLAQRAARLLERGPAGRVLLTQAAREAAAGWMERQRWKAAPAGKVALTKGDETEEIYRLETD
jgi:pSer/pThr/pTyr-binding forkhead associated (FHA) protein